MWQCDNPVFNVNGESLEKLTKTLELALDGRKIKHYKINSKGFVLYWSETSKKDVASFPILMPADQLSAIVHAWVNDSDHMDNDFQLSGSDSDYDHDGHNGRGWRVYTEDWGHVGDDGYAFLAILPIHLWFGK